MKALRAVHLNGRRIVVLLFIAVLAAAATGGFILREKATYKAQTTVFASQALGGLANGANVTSAGDFQAALKLPAVLSSVSDTTGVSVTALRKVGSSNDPSSSAVVVSFTNTSQQTATSVVTDISQTALGVLDQQLVAAAQDQVTSAQQALTAADKSLATFNQSSGYGDYEAKYQQVLQTLVNLNTQALAASGSSLTQINAEIGQQTALLNQLTALQPQYQALSNSLTQAQSAYDTAAQSLTTAQGELLSSKSTSIVTSPQITKQGVTSKAVRSAVTAAVVVLILGTLLFAAADSRRRGSGRRKPVSSPASEDPGTGPGTPQSKEPLQTTAKASPVSAPGTRAVAGASKRAGSGASTGKRQAPRRGTISPTPRGSR